MRHLNEGEIHAYLDGALDLVAGEDAGDLREHLATCRDCARRLEDERGIREAAGEILHRSDPVEIPLPPLEELKERALAPPAPVREGEAPPPSHRRWRTWQVPLTWAATVVLALGIGWRVGVQFPGANDPELTAGTEGAFEESDADRAGAHGQAVAAEDRSSPRSSDAPAQAFPPERGAGDSPEDSRRQEAVPAAARGRGETRPSVMAEAVMAEEARQRDEMKGTEPAAPLPETPVEAEEVAEPPVPDPSVADSVLVAQEVVDLSASRVEGFQPVQPGELQLARARNTAADEELQAPVEAGLVPPSMGGVLARGDLSGSSLAVPGHPVLEVKWEEWMPGQEGLMIRQLLPTGDTLELRYLGILSGEATGAAPAIQREKAREAAKALPAPPLPMVASLPPGWNQVTVQWRSGWLVARAPLSQGQLMTLVRSIF